MHNGSREGNLMNSPSDTSALGHLGTEQVRSDLAQLDTLSIEDLVDLMCADIQRIPDALGGAKHTVAEAIAVVLEHLKLGGRLVYVGAGTAGRLGMLDAAEVGPTFGVPAGQVIGVLAGGTNAFSIPVENAEDDRPGGAEALRNLKITESDVVIGISASGRTPYVLGAIEAANAVGAASIGIACNTGTALADLASIPIEIPVGPELIAGSTRLNAGTIQKLILNIISTVTMVRLGKTHGNLMVDVRPTNDKLRARAVRIVAEIAGTSDAEALTTLIESGWRTKVAALMLAGGMTADSATGALAAHGNHLRSSLNDLTAGAETCFASPRHGGWLRLGVASAIVGGTIVPGDLAIRDGEIVAVGLAHPGTGLAVPGLVDLQVNGYAGVDIMDADPDALAAMSRALLRDGIFAFLPTLISSELGTLRQAARRITEFAAKNVDGAAVLGLHLEGPFLSSARAGTHPLDRLLAPDPTLLEELLDIGSVRIVTLAPELDGALELVRICRQHGVVVSLGHSAADAAQAAAAFAVGASSVTHLFNAMEPLLARAPGLAGAALATSSVALQIIADGVHIADEMIQLAFAAAPGRCSIVSDAMAAAAVGDGAFRLGEVDVVVQGGIARRDDGTLAGSVGKLREGLVRLGRLGIATLDAVNAASNRPAQLAGTARYGELHVGSRADLLVLDDELAISRIVVAGHEVEAA